MNVDNLIHKGESQTLEFKESFSNMKKILETVAAFANARGGKIIVGVRDDGSIVGTNISKESIQEVVNKVKQASGGNVIPDMYTYVFDDKEVVVLIIQEYPLKPLVMSGKYFVRVQNSNHLMTTDMIADMTLKTKYRSFDMFLVEGKTIEDLDQVKILKAIDCINRLREYPLNRDVSTFLKKFELVKGNQITHAAYLLFPIQEIDHTEIMIGLFEDDITIKKSKTIRGSLIDAVDEVMDFVMAYITKEYIITGKPVRDERWQYPLEAVREFIINAIVHRKYIGGTHSQFRVYRNKLVFWNYGALDPNLTIQQLYDGTERSYIKNLKIAEIFKEIGLIEKYGSGIRRYIDTIKKHGLPIPKIQEVSGGIEVIIYDKSFLARDPINDPISDPISDPIKILYEYIQNHPGKSSIDAEGYFSVSNKTIKRRLKVLIDTGKIEHRGSKKKGGYWPIENGNEGTEVTDG